MKITHGVVHTGFSVLFSKLQVCGICTCSSQCVYVTVHAYRGQRSTMGALFHHPPLYFLTEPGAIQPGWLVNEFQGSQCLHLPVLVLQTCICDLQGYTQLFAWVLEIWAQVLMLGSMDWMHSQLRTTRTLTMVLGVTRTFILILVFCQDRQCVTDYLQSCVHFKVESYFPKWMLSFYGVHNSWILLSVALQHLLKLTRIERHLPKPL